MDLLNLQKTHGLSWRTIGMQALSFSYATQCGVVPESFGTTCSTRHSTVVTMVSRMKMVSIPTDQPLLTCYILLYTKSENCAWQYIYRQHGSRVLRPTAYRDSKHLCHFWRTHFTDSISQQNIDRCLANNQASGCATSDVMHRCLLRTET